MEFLKFLITKIFIKNLLIAAGICIILVFSTLLWLKIFTHHSQAITVPEFTGLLPEEVDIIARSKKLRIEIADSSYSDDLPRGTVIKQNPVSGSKVKENRRIYLTMNAMNPEKVIMPNVTGVSLRQARAILETYGLTIGKLSYKPDIAINNVLEQRMSDSVAMPGSLVIKGSSVNLVLGKGLSNETTLVPDLTGMNFIRVKEMLMDRYLNIGAVIYDSYIKTSEDSVLAFVWRQRPEFGTDNRLNLGANVDLWLTTDSTKLPVPEELLLIPELNTENENIDW